jgi:hypothetical protein
MSSSTPSWSRYGSQRRRCARAGCNAPAVATLRFQPTERRAWLAELDDSAARTQGDLCHRHAVALVLPRGWELHDERPLVVAGGAPPREAAPGEMVDAGEVVGVVDVVEVEAVGAEVAEEEAAAEEPAATDDPPEPDAAAPDVPPNGTGPVPGADDEAVEEALDSILDARTPLLQRAFRNARPAS